MAFPTDWSRKCTLVIQSSQVDANLVDFPVLLTSDTLPSEMFDADGSYTAISGGGDIRFSSDSVGDTRLSCEIVDFTTDNDPANGTAEVWVKVPTVSSGTDTTIYVWYNKAGETQPAEDGAYGKESVWDNHYTMVQHMNDATTSTITDSTSNDVDGTKKGANEPIETSSGQIGEGQSYDGSGEYINLGDNLDPGTGDWTAEVWFKLPSQTTSQYLFTKRNDDDIPIVWPFLVRVLKNNDASYPGELEYYTRYDAELDALRSGDAVNDDAWHSVALVRDADVGKLLYLDGGAAKTSEGNKTDDLNNTEVVRIGLSTGGTIFCNGIIDEIRFSNIVRSAEWVGAGYKNQYSPATFVIEGTPEFCIYYFSGYVFEQNNPVSRKLYLHDRLAGDLITTTTSSGNGYYYMETTSSGSHYIVCLDDVAGEEYNDLIIGNAFPTEIT